MEGLLYLTDKNGVQIPFEYLDTVDYGGEQYIILLPYYDDDDTDDVTILRIEACEDGDMENYMSVEDDDTLVAVYNIFKEKYKDQLNFAEE